MATSRSASAKLRPTPKCHAPSRLRFGRIIEETLAENLVAAPFLQAHLVDPKHLAGFVGQLENPVNGDVVALDHRRHRLGIDMRHARQNAALAGDQQVAAAARRACVLLHAGILGVIALDGAGMIASLDDGDKLIETGSRRHETSNASVADQILGSENSDTACDLRRRLANDARVRTASPSSTGGYTTRLTADQP